MIKKFKRLIKTSQSKYVAKIEKKDITQQCSYNLPIELEGYLKSLNILMKYKGDSDTNILYKIRDDYKIELSDNIYVIIGSKYNSISNKAIFTHTEGDDGTSAKIQLKKTDFKDQNDESYNWFVDLYEKNLENIYFIVYVDDEKKTIKFDLELSKEMFEVNGNNVFDYDTYVIPNRKARDKKIYPLNSIIYGAPGTGKTYSTPEYALAIIENKKNEEIRKEYKDRKSLMDKYKEYINSKQIVFTTFHQNYTYEDFIQGLRPVKADEGYAFVEVDGIFKKISDEAIKDNNNNYVLIIDEINRANISKVLGELITLIEDDKRWGEENGLTVTLPSGHPFAVPNNLYIVGTMNSADKSISLIDVALRRRFDFIEQEVNYDLITDSKLNKLLRDINEKLESDLNTTDLLIGHAYFMDKSEDELVKIMNQNIIPLLYEYYFDDTKKVKSLLENCIKDDKYYISDKVGRIKLTKKGC